ncbi:MAG TPA: hypothetical protein VFW24_14685 [Acidimicrobiales bacterium]|nr:hypothetical protein [Acidimicrobiales bacterium]
MNTTVETDRLTYRPLREDELGVVVHLYDLAGWGPVTEQWVRSWLVHGPLGPALVMGIVDDRGEVLGMTTYGAVRVQTFDEEVLACRGRAAVLVPELRRSGRRVSAVDEHDPLYQLSLAARAHLRDRGWTLLYGIPHPTMQKRSDISVAPPLGRRDRCAIPGVRFEIAGVEPGPMPLDVTIGERPGEEYDRLWIRARVGLGIECAVLRDARGLAATRGNVFIECRLPGSDELVGYWVVDVTSSGKGRLMDYLAADEDALLPVALTASNWLRRHQIPTDEGPVTCRYVSCLAHERYSDALRGAGATDIDWPFAFSVSCIDENGPDRPEHDPRRWYVTTGD